MLKFISTIQPRQVTRLLPGLRYLFMVYHFSRKLAETSSFIPQLLRTAKDSYTVRWVPAVIDQRVNKIFRSLIAAFPTAKELRIDVSAFPGSSETKQEPAIPEQLRSLISYFIGQFIQEVGAGKQMMGDPPGI